MKLSTKEMMDVEADLNWSRTAHVSQRNAFRGW
jgi:hypothetical protein